MTRREKLIAKIRARPVQADYDDVKAVLEFCGWRQRPESGSSHAVFEKDGERAISVPRKGGRMVKRVYLDQICDRLGLDE